MGSCLSRCLTDCVQGHRYHGWELNEVKATMGPLNEEAAEICPYCSGVVRNAHQIWLDELEEELLNARCVSRIVKYDDKTEQLLLKYKIDDHGDNPAVDRVTSKTKKSNPAGGDTK